MVAVWCRSAREEEFTEARLVGGDLYGSSYSVFSCTPAPVPFPLLTLELLWEYPPADFFEVGTLFVVSGRLRDALLEFDVPAEFFPVRVTRSGGVLVAGAYSICNILRLVACFDLIRGNYTFEEHPALGHHVQKIHRLAIDDALAAGHDLFRIADGGAYIVCVSDRLADRITKGGFTGVRLISPETWRCGVAFE